MKQVRMKLPQNKVLLRIVTNYIFKATCKASYQFLKCRWRIKMATAKMACGQKSTLPIPDVHNLLQNSSRQIFLNYWNYINPLNGDVSVSQLNAEGVSKWPPLKIYQNVFRFKQNLVWLFLLAICSNMQKIRPISQIFTEILRFEIFEITRLCCTLTYKNWRNSLNS